MPTRGNTPTLPERLLSKLRGLIPPAPDAVLEREAEAMKRRHQIGGWQPVGPSEPPSPPRGTGIETDVIANIHDCARDGYRYVASAPDWKVRCVPANQHMTTAEYAAWQERMRSREAARQRKLVSERMTMSAEALERHGKPGEPAILRLRPTVEALLQASTAEAAHEKALELGGLAILAVGELTALFESLTPPAAPAPLSQGNSALGGGA